MAARQPSRDLVPESPANLIPLSLLPRRAAITPNASDFEDDAGSGLENVKASDLLVPRLTILQALSPQLNPKKPEYIEGAKVGQICDVGMGEIFPDGVLFLPVYYSKVWLEWAPRSTGKGLVAIHGDDAVMAHTTKNDKKQSILANGNLIAETAQFFGLNVTANFRMCYVPMASTQLKKGRKWLNLATGEKLSRADGSTFDAPLYYRTYTLTTAEESNNEGDWIGWRIDRAPTLPELESIGIDWRGMKTEAVRLRDLIAAGNVKADTTGLDDGNVVDVDSDGVVTEKKM